LSAGTGGGGGGGATSGSAGSVLLVLPQDDAARSIIRTIGATNNILNIIGDFMFLCVFMAVCFY
jgi:hypothetical protein